MQYTKPHHRLEVDDNGLVVLPRALRMQLLVALLRGDLYTVLFEQEHGGRLDPVGWWVGFSRTLPYLEVARKERGPGRYYVSVERPDEKILSFSFEVEPEWRVRKRERKEAASKL